MMPKVETMEYGISNDPASIFLPRTLSEMFMHLPLGVIITLPLERAVHRSIGHHISLARATLSLYSNRGVWGAQSNAAILRCRYRGVVLAVPSFDGKVPDYRQ